MDKRKGIILAVIIFLLIGLGTFVFANPSEKSLNENDNNSNNQNSTEKEDLDNENTNDGLGEEGEEENEPDTDRPTNVVIGGNKEDSNNNNGNDNGDDSEDIPSNPSTPEEPQTPEVDKTAPIIVINDKEYQGLDNSIGYLNTKVTLSLAEKDLSVTISKDGKEVSFTDGMTLAEDGKYVLSVKDEYDNETVVEFGIDMTAPEISITDGSFINTNISPRIKEDNLASATIIFNDGEEEDYLVNNGIGREISKEGKYTITLKDKAGQEISVTFTIDKTAPSIKADSIVYGPDYNETIYTDKQFKGEAIDELSGIAKITTNTHERDWIDVSGEGNYTFVITDKAGNSSTFKVVIDKTAPKITNVPKNNTSVNYPINPIIEDENIDTVKVYLNGKEITGWYESWLVNGAYSLNKEGTYKIEAVDKVGHNTTVTFTIDKTKPVYTALGLLNLTHYNEKGDVTVANIGDIIRIFVQFDEELAVNPQVAFGDGTAVKMNLTSNDAFDKYTYYADVTLTEEMNLEDGNISFKVFGYADAAKNIGDDLTDNNIKTNDNITYEGVRLDTTPPIATSIVINSSNNDDYHYANENHYIGIYLTVDEILVKNPTFIINGGQSCTSSLVQFNELQNGYKYAFLCKLPKDANQGEVKFEITNVEDLAGNKIMDVISSTITDTDKTSVIFDSINPEIKIYKNGIEDVTAKDKYNYYVAVEANDTNLDTLKVLKDGKEYSYDKLIGEVGNYEVIAIDKAGNESHKEFSIDTNYPVVTINNDKYNTQDNITVHYYNEINNVNIDEENLDYIKMWFNGAEVEYQENYNYIPGEYKIEVKDTHLNKTIVVFEVDTEEPELTMLRVQNFYNPSNNQNYAKIGDKIAITLVTSEPLKENPYIEIGGKTFEVELQEAQFNKYVVYVELTSDMALTDNEKIPVKIKKLTDRAGNYSYENYETTGDDNYYVILDKTPTQLTSVTFKNLDAYNGNLDYAKAGNRVWLYLTFSERLLQDPVVTMNGTAVSVVQRENGDNWNEPWEKVVYEYIIPDDAKEGTIDVEVTGIYDKNGNETKTITDKDFNSSVTIDITRPKFTPESWNRVFDLDLNGGITKLKYDFTDNYTDFEDLIITETCDINLAKEGTYNCHYSAYDKAGNSAWNTVTATVKDISAPVFTGIESNSTYFVKFAPDGVNKLGGGILLKVKDNSNRFDIYIDNVKWFGLSNDDDAIHFKNGMPYQDLISNADICAIDANGSKSCVKNVTILAADSINIKSALSSGGNIILPDNSTFDASDFTTIADNTVISGNNVTIEGSLDITANNVVLNDINFKNGSLTLSGDNITLNNVNINYEGTALYINPISSNIVINGGNYTTTGGQRGQGTIRLNAIGTDTYSSDITIEGVNVYGSVHLLNYGGSLETITNNNINAANPEGASIVGILITNDTKYSQKDMDNLYYNQGNMIQMNYFEDTLNYYVRLEKAEFGHRYGIEVKPL